MITAKPAGAGPLAATRLARFRARRTQNPFGPPITCVTRSQLLDIPLVLSPSGQLLFGAGHVVAQTDDPHELLRRALATGRPVQISVLVRPRELPMVGDRLDEALREVVATTYLERE